MKRALKFTVQTIGARWPKISSIVVTRQNMMLKPLCRDQGVRPDVQETKKMVRYCQHNLTTETKDGPVCEQLPELVANDGPRNPESDRVP